MNIRDRDNFQTKEIDLFLKCPLFVGLTVYAWIIYLGMHHICSIIKEVIRDVNVIIMHYAYLLFLLLK